MDTNPVAEQFEISRRRVQQLSELNREHGNIPPTETAGRPAYGDYSDDHEARVLAVHEMVGFGAVAVAHVRRVKDGLSFDNNRVHAILKEHDKRDREIRTNRAGKRPWVRFEREYSLVTARMDWYQMDRVEWGIAVDDDASRFVLEMIETHRPSSAKLVEVLDEARQTYESDVPILEVITDHGSEFVNTHRDERPCPEHDFEGYLDENDIKHTLCKGGRTQSSGKLERFYQTYEKHRWWFDSLDEFLTFYNEVRPHMSLDWDALETPKEAFDRSLPQPEIDIEDPLATEVTADD